MSVLIHINDHPLTIEKGTTILQAARQNGIDIPTLCDFPGLPSHGSCRLCIVEIEGRQNTPTSCTTPVEEGMVVYTHSPKVMALRAELLQMLLSEHPSGCLFCPEKDRCDECMVTLRKAAVTTGCGSCPKDNQCELQALAEKYGVEKPNYPIRYHMLPVEKNDPFFDRDYNLCILCGRCIRVCEDLHFANVLAYTQRGTHAVVGTAFHLTHLESSCTFCGGCVEVCPTGALSEKTRKWDGKPESETASTCPLCSIGCQINLLSKKERVIGSHPNRRAGTDALCVKGRFGITELVNHPTRLKQPTIRAGHTRLEIDWEAAIRTAAEKLAACPPERFEMLISAGCTNEDLYVANKFAREVMKSSAVYINELARYGGGLDSVVHLLKHAHPLEIAEEASAVLCLGLEDKYAQSVVEVQLHRAKNRGAKIITIGSHKHNWGSYADVWLPVQPGKETELIQELVERTGQKPPTDQHNNFDAPEEISALVRATRLLQQADSPVIILRPAILTHADNRALLQAVDLLIQNLSARVIVLPEEGNLGGALLNGYLSHTVPDSQNLDVLYLIGQPIPLLPASQPFILYQNMYPPVGEPTADLVLPTTAFTEENGTFIDYAGRVQTIHPAVKPTGEVLPSWMILSRIARQMGMQEFDYTCVEDIQEEIPGFAVALQGDRHIDRQGYTTVSENSVRTGVISQPQLHPAGEHSYMGFPLAHWVEGLRMLYSEESSGRVHEPNP